MSLSVNVNDQTTVLKVSGELDFSTAQDLSSLYTRSKPVVGQVVFDLDGLKFVDSTGVGTLLTIWKDLQGSQLPYSVLNIDIDVYEVLDLLGLVDFLGNEHLSR